LDKGRRTDIIGNYVKWWTEESAGIVLGSFCKTGTNCIGLSEQMARDQTKERSGLA
jgi:hypothetical protein